LVPFYFIWILKGFLGFVFVFGGGFWLLFNQRGFLGRWIEDYSNVSDVKILRMNSFGMNLCFCVVCWFFLLFFFLISMREFSSALMGFLGSSCGGCIVVLLEAI